MKNSLQRYSIWYKRHLQKPTRTFPTLFIDFLSVASLSVSLPPRISMYFSPRLTCQKRKKKKKGKREKKRGKKLVRERVIQGRLRNGTRRYLFQMDNSAYMPNHLPPPSLVVFSQAGGLPEALRMQRPFNPQVSVLLSLPICLSLCLLLLLKLCLPTRKSGENNICDRTCYSATNSSPRVLLTRVAIRFAL